MNKIQVVGRITKDVELQHTMGNNINYARFNLASKSKTKNADGELQTNFFICVAWRELAETISKYCKKGDLVYIMGSMESRKYDNAGETQTVWEIKVDDIEFLTTRAEREQAESAPKSSKKKTNEQEMIPLDPDEDDGLPF